MQYMTYANLKALIQALAGVDAFTTAEDTKILALANRRLYQAYSANPMWPRYLIAAQARPAPLGVIPYTYDEAAGVRTPSTATRTGTTVTLKCTAAVDVVVGQYVTFASITYSTTNPNGAYQITGLSTTTNTNDTVTYELTSGTGTETYTVASATFSPVAIPAIEQVIRIWDNQPFDLNSAVEYDYTSAFAGITVVNNYRDLTGFWVAFKQRWGGPYVAADTTIPLEHYYYAAHAAYADFLRMDGQIDKAMAEESVAQTYLTLEIDKAETQRNNNAVFRRISTHISRQGRQW